MAECRYQKQSYNPLTDSTRFSDVSASLANLTGEVRILDITGTINQISNSPDMNALMMVGKPRVEGDTSSTIDLNKLWVDMTYQRSIRLKKILNKLKDKGFMKSAAGAIDVAHRPHRKESNEFFVWDGLRRCVMGALCGESKLLHSMFKHSTNSDVSCRKEEAKLFKIRNADNETMRPEEIWKSKIVYDDVNALKLYHLFDKCQIDVLGVVNPNYVKLGGFKEIENQYLGGHQISESSLIHSSNILQRCFQNSNNISVFLWAGLAYLIMLNETEDINKSYDLSEIEECIEEKVNQYNWKQKDFTRPRFSGKTCESVAYRITKDVLEDTNGLLKSVESRLTTEEIEEYRMISDDAYSNQDVVDDE